MKKAFTLICCLLAAALPRPSSGQISFRYDLRPSVSIDGKALFNPWAGGLNTTQYSTMRLNDDARDDLVVFDRASNKVSTFVAVDNPVGSGIAWQYAPEYETAFPTVLYSWLLLADYDGDGKKDLFTYGAGTVRVLHNESQAGKVVFRIVADPLITESFSGKLPLFATGADLPAITDFDDDGDVDIITFDSSGNLVTYQQNMSVERTGKPGLDFKRSNNVCWGHFQKEYCNDFTFGLNCDFGSGSIDTRPAGQPNGARPAHAGNALTMIDTDGDGKKDLLFGFVSCENVARLRNTGTNDANANFTSFDSLYPAQAPILFPAFPATYWEDVDGDGVKDLLASPNVDLNENRLFDFRSSGWFYKNRGTNQKPDFQLIQKDFLQQDMLDLGERAAPALADLDGDGDLDMLVGYGGVGTGNSYRGGIWQFENRGTTQNPAFVLITTDYLGLMTALPMTNVVPSFTDVDANGSQDLIIVGQGTQRIEIRVLLNAAPRGAAVRYDLSSAVRWSAPDLMVGNDLLTVTDVDGDTKSDLLIGRYAFGTILYYRNAGTAQSPTFQLQNQTFGGFTAGTDVTYIRARSLVVTDLNGDRKNELVAAADNGTMRVYQFPERPDQSLTLIDSLPALGLPGRGLIAAAGDLDGDQLPDLMVGTLTGGLRYLKNTSQKVVVTGISDEPVSPWAYPNPTDRYVTVKPAYDGQLELVSLAGQTMLPAQVVKADTETLLDLSSLSDGTYLLRLLADGRSTLVQKVVVWK